MPSYQPYPGRERIVSIAGTVLIVAPDRTFRESLAFLLEAEGCHVRQLVALPPASSPMGLLDCVVVDDAAFAQDREALSRWRELRCPIILLTDCRRDAPNAEYIQVVEKPILGAALVEAVRSAIALGPSAVGTT